jgi:hypothetical protein
LKKYLILLLAVFLLASVLTGCSGGSKEAKVTQESQQYTDRGQSVHFQGTADYRPEGFGTYSVYPTYYITQYVGATDIYSVREVRLHGVKIVKQPKIGKLSIALHFQTESEPKSSGKDFAVWNGLPPSMSIGVKSDHLGSYALGENFSGSHGTAWAFKKHVVQAGITSDHMRFTIGYQLEITDMKGNKYRRNVEIEVLPVDFIALSGEAASYRHDFDYSEPFGK